MTIQKPFPVKFLFFAALLAAVIVFPFLFKDAAFLAPGRITLWLEAAGALAPILYMAVMALIVATPIPSMPLNFAAGAFFGPILGTLYSVTGATGGALISFTIARFLGREFLERFLKGHIHFCAPCSDKLLTKAVFFARLVPVFSFDMISYGAGLTKMSVRNYVIANILGMLPLTFVFNYAGTMFVVGNLPGIVLGAVMVAAFFLLPGWIERRNLFSLRRFFEHPPEESVENKNDSQ